MKILSLLTFSLLLFSSCYHFKNVSIAPEIEDYYVYEFKTSVSNVEANFSFKLEELLKSKIRQETNLKYREEKPDIEIKANLVNYEIKISDLSADNRATENEVLATFEVNYFDNTNEDNNWKKTFKERTTYSTDIDYLDAESSLQKILLDQLNENIFNALFNNW